MAQCVLLHLLLIVSTDTKISTQRIVMLDGQHRLLACLSLDLAHRFTKEEIAGFKQESEGLWNAMKQTPFLTQVCM